MPLRDVGVIDGQPYLVATGVAGQVHGRLHPCNVLLDDQGQMRLPDFAVPMRVTDANSQAAQSQTLAH